MLELVSLTSCVTNSVLKTQLITGSPSSTEDPLIACVINNFQGKDREIQVKTLTNQSSRRFDMATLLMVTRGIFLSRDV